MNKTPNQLSLPFSEEAGDRQEQNRAELFRLLSLARAKDPEAIRKLRAPPHNLRIWLRDV